MGRILALLVGCSLSAHASSPLNLRAFQNPNCEDMFFYPETGNFTGQYVFMDYPLATPYIAALIPDNPLKTLLSDVGVWCNPSLWWPLSYNETSQRNLIGVMTEMAVFGCQYYGNSYSFMYNARNLGFKGFVISNLASSDTCSTSIAINGSFPSKAHKQRMSVCSNVPYYTASLVSASINNEYTSQGYLGVMVPSLIEIFKGPFASFPPITLTRYECEVQEVANSPYMFAFMIFLVLFRSYVFVKGVMLLRPLAVRQRFLALAGVLFGGVLSGLFAIFEIIATPNDMPGVNYWPIIGQKDGVVLMYLPICLGMCSDLAMAWLWLKIGLNLRRLQNSRVYEVCGLLLCMIPMPVLIPIMLDETFDLYSKETSLIRQVVTEVLRGTGIDEIFALAFKNRSQRRDLYNSLNNTVFGFAVANTALFTLVQFVALWRIISASTKAKTRSGYKTLRRLVVLVLVQTVCLITQAILIYFSQSLSFDVISRDKVPALIGLNYLRMFAACFMSAAQVIAFQSAASKSAMSSSSTSTLHEGDEQDGRASGRASDDTNSRPTSRFSKPWSGRKSRTTAGEGAGEVVPFEKPAACAVTEP